MYELHTIPTIGAHSLWTAGIAAYINHDVPDHRLWFVRCRRTGEAAFMHFLVPSYNHNSYVRFRTPYMSFFKSYYIK